MDKEVTKSAALFAACKAEVGVEIGIDYCRMLSNGNGLSEHIRSTYAGLAEVLEKARELNVEACNEIEKIIAD